MARRHRHHHHVAAAGGPLAGHHHHRPHHHSTVATAAPVGGYSPGIPLCWQCGTRQNPCGCKVVGPTVAFLAFCVAAAIEWPVGSVVYCFRRLKGRRILTHPNRVVYPRVRSAIPI